MNGHTATIRSLGITGVLLLLALVLLALVSAIFAFDRWPDSGGAGTVERVAVDRPDARRAETVLVRSRRPAPVVRGVFVARTTGAFATVSGAGDAILVDDREPVDQSDGGGFGPPPPTVPLVPPGEGGGVTRFTGSGSGDGPSVQPPDDDSIIRQATCGARDALGQAGRPLDPACEPANPGQRSLVARTVSGTITAADELAEGLTAAR